MDCLQTLLTPQLYLCLIRTTQKTFSERLETPKFPRELNVNNKIGGDLMGKKGLTWMLGSVALLALLHGAVACGGGDSDDTA